MDSCHDLVKKAQMGFFYFFFLAILINRIRCQSNRESANKIADTNKNAPKPSITPNKVTIRINKKLKITKNIARLVSTQNLLWLTLIDALQYGQLKYQGFNTVKLCEKRSGFLQFGHDCMGLILMFIKFKDMLKYPCRSN